MTNRTALLGAFFSLAIGGTGAASTWDLDTAHTTAQFSARHMMVSTVRGQFQKVTGTVTLNDKDPTKSNVDVSIDVDSIDTRDPKRDGHLKSPDFFDAAKNPKITFKSTKIEKLPGGKYKVTGDLTMHGVTHPAALQVDTFTDPVKAWGQTRRGISASGLVSRKDWGMTWNKTLDSGGLLVSDDIQLQIDAEIVEKTPGSN
jgi:polyisoprenoid-binding protein YceI